MRCLRRSRLFVRAFSCVAAAFALAACGGGADGPATPGAGAADGGAGGTSSSDASGGSPGPAPVLAASQQKVGVLVPAYFSGGTGSSWATLSSSQQQFPGVQITAVLNQSNGVFTSANAALLAAVQDFTAKGGKVVGYVNTSKGGRALTDVESNIAAYANDYGPYVTGVFLDVMSGDPAQLPFYQSVAAYVAKNFPTMTVIGNPGSYPDPGYANVANTLVVREINASAWNNFDPSRYPWTLSRGNGGQAVLIQGASCADMQNIVQVAATPNYNIGWVDATDYDLKTGGSAWKGLPSYWTTLLGTVDAINKGQPLPKC